MIWLLLWGLLIIIIHRDGCVYLDVNVAELMFLPVTGLRWIMLWSPSAFWLRLPSPSKSTAPYIQQGSRPRFHVWNVQTVLTCLLFALRCVTASVSASASMTQQLLSGRAPRPKPFRVTNADRSVKKGIMADVLQDLMNKVRKEAGTGVVEWAEGKLWHS